MGKCTYRKNMIVILNTMLLLIFLLFTQTEQVSGESLQKESENYGSEEFQEINNRYNDRISFLESEQRKIPGLVKSAIDNVLATVIERKVKELEGRLKNELRALEMDLKSELGDQVGTLDVNLSDKIKVVEENTEKALNTLSETLKDEMIVQFLGRDMEIASTLTELKKELERGDNEVAAALPVVSKDSQAEGKESAMKSEEPTIYGYQNNLQEESKQSLLLISQMFEYLDEKDREIASLSKRLSVLEASSDENMQPGKGDSKKKME